MRLGILGGTFDPIHYAHLFVAEDARHAVGLDRVLFVPNRHPPHKLGAPLAPAEERLAMVRLAVAGNPRFECSDVEVRREGLSYTADTLAELHGMYPDAELHFIIGLDAVLELASWHRPDDVVRLARLVAVARPGYPAEECASRLPAEYLDRMTILPTLGLELSSSALRERVRTGRSIRYLTPDAVLSHIESRRLYR